MTPPHHHHISGKSASSPIAAILLTALPAEAKPLRQAFELIRENRFTALPLYRNDRLALAITGSGPESAQQAIVKLARQLPLDPECLWINCGIAGHPDLPLGTPVAIDRLGTADESEYTHVESLDEKLVKQPLISHPKAEFGYAKPACVDMESAYLYRELLRQIPNPRFTCFKVISDKAQSRGAGISGKQVSAWMDALIPFLKNILKEIKETE